MYDALVKLIGRFAWYRVNEPFTWKDSLIRPYTRVGMDICPVYVQFPGRPNAAMHPVNWAARVLVRFNPEKIVRVAWYGDALKPARKLSLARFYDHPGFK